MYIAKYIQNVWGKKMSSLKMQFGTCIMVNVNKYIYVEHIYFNCEGINSIENILVIIF